MLGFIVSGVASVVATLNRYLPSLRLIQRIVHRRGSHKWGVPAMLLAVPYLLVANVFKGILEDGGDAWFSVPLLWCLVMGIVFLALGPISLLLLTKARTREAVTRWNARHDAPRTPEKGESTEQVPSPSDPR